MKPLIRSTDTTDIFEFIQWCRNYNQFNIYPCGVLKRYAIAIYQLSQGINWNDTKTNYKEYESFAAACIHFWLASEQAGVDIENSASFDRVVNFQKLLFKQIDYKHLLLQIATGQQQIVYAESKNISRGSRFSKDRLRETIGNIISILMASIPVDKRGESIYQATDIMTRKL